MRKVFPIRLVVLVLLGMISSVPGTATEGDTKCQPLTRSCAVCEDGKLRDPMTGLLLGKLSPLSDYACATNGGSDRKIVPSLATLQRCAVLSDSCAVCPDGQFVTASKGKVIESSLYECAKGGPSREERAKDQKQDRDEQEETEEEHRDEKEPGKKRDDESSP